MGEIRPKYKDVVELCHLDVKLDNILVFRSDFSLVKLCDFGSVRNAGDIVIKKNELLPYCPAELVARHANEYYQVDRVQDVFQFGIVVFYCLQGILPWQKPTWPTRTLVSSAAGEARET